MITSGKADIKDLIITTLTKEVAPAMGCTEPVAVALAASRARELHPAPESIHSIEVLVSPNIYKNGLAVGIPGTREVGLFIAAALGFTCGDSKNDLKILSTVSHENLIAARKILEDGILGLDIKDTSQKIYIEVTLKSNENISKAIISGRHNQFVYLQIDENILLDIQNEDEASAEHNPLFDSSFIGIISEIEHLPFEAIEFLLEGAKMNKAISEYGLSQNAGMQIGATLNKSSMLSNDLMTRAMILTASASDARMDGVSMPVMSSNGSGNNGLTAILPIVAYHELFHLDDDRYARAIAMSHIVNSYIKNAIGRLSALCGCGVAAGTGASVALAWLMGSSHKQLEFTVKNMLANTSGMICDGAKVGCALKLATSASAAVQSAILANNDIAVPAYNGIIGDTVEKTIDNLRILSNEGMLKADQVMLNIMREMQVN